MGLIRKSWRFATFGLTGVPLAHKRSKKDHIVRNTNRTALAMEQIARQQASEPASRLARFKQDMDGFTQPSRRPQAGPPPGPPPGWYQDPSGGGHRWWDGTAWTEHTVTHRG